MYVYILETTWFLAEFLILQQKTNPDPTLVQILYCLWLHIVNIFWVRVFTTWLDRISGSENLVRRKIIHLQRCRDKGKENLNNREGQPDSSPVDRYYFTFIRLQNAFDGTLQFKYKGPLFMNIEHTRWIL